MKKALGMGANVDAMDEEKVSFTIICLCKNLIQFLNTGRMEISNLG